MLDRYAGLVRFIGSVGQRIEVFSDIIVDEGVCFLLGGIRAQVAAVDVVDQRVVHVVQVELSLHGDRLDGPGLAQNPFVHRDGLAAFVKPRLLRRPDVQQGNDEIGVAVDVAGLLLRAGADQQIAAVVGLQVRSSKVCSPTKMSKVYSGRTDSAFMSMTSCYV